jgi:hypothetical protein
MRPKADIHLRRRKFTGWAGSRHSLRRERMNEIDRKQPLKNVTNSLLCKARPKELSPENESAKDL